jgi:chemotaxis protein methyltransferase CheR
MTRTGLTEFTRYRQLLESDSGVFDDLLTELVIGETYFFRDAAQFEFVRREVLPEVRRRRGSEHVLRAWSAGCASGEEAYSLAMLLDSEGWAGRSQVLGTDISPRALAAARRGSYREWSFRGDGAAHAMRFVTRRGEEHVVADALRGRVEFKSLNLALEGYPATALDLILCRNVLIYFDPVTVASVAQRLFESLAPGGWLVTGASDPPLGEHAPFETVIAPEGVFLRRGLNEPAMPNGGWALLPVPAFEKQDRQECPSSDAPNASPANASVSEAHLQTDFEQAVRPTAERTDDAETCVIQMRALANSDLARAEQVCGAATVRHPLSAELHYLHAVLLLELGQIEAAASAARRVIYLDRSLALAHFMLGSILRGLGDVDGARRAFRNARDLCQMRPVDELVPFSDGEQAGRLKEAADLQLTLLSGSSSS